MQKFIRVLAIIAAVLVALSLLALLISIPCQRLIAGSWFHYPEQMVAALPIFPLAHFIHCFLLLGCTALMIVCAGNKKGGIWLEILLLVMLALVVPVLSTALTNVQTILTGHLRGDSYVAANSVVNQISGYCMWPGNLGNSLSLVACGMSIAFKQMSKKVERITPQA